MKKVLAFAKARKKTTAASVVAVIAGSALAFNSFAGTADETRYVLEAAARGMLMTSVTGTGQVEGELQIDLDPEVSGDITKLYVSSGTHVDEGDVIALIDASEAQKNVRDARMNLENAELSYAEQTAGADALEIREAERALEKAEEALAELTGNPDEDDVADAEDAVEDAERMVAEKERDLDELMNGHEDDIADAADESYAALTEGMSDLADVLDDLHDFMGTETNGGEYLGYYDLILENTSATDTLEDLVAEAADAYAEASSLYRGTSRESSTDEKIKVTESVVQASETIADAVDEAVRISDDMEREGYEDSTVASHITSMGSTLASAHTTVNQTATTLKNSADELEDLTENYPYDVADAEDAYEDAKESLARAKEDLIELQEGGDTGDIADAEILVAQKQEALDELTSGLSRTELRQAQLSLESKQNAYADALEELDKYTVRAPISGTLANMTARVGESASAGVLGTVIADDLMVNVSLNEVDIAKVSVGDKVTATFDAVDGLSISAKVVGRDSIGTVSQGVVTYGVQIAFDTEDERVLSGMTTSVTIITDVVSDALIVPLSAVTTVGDTSYVQTLEKHGETETGKVGVTSSTSPEMVEVTLGLTSDTEAEIVSGIEEGQEIVTRTITDENTSNSTSNTSSTSSLFGGGGGGNFEVKGGGTGPVMMRSF